MSVTLCSKELYAYRLREIYSRLVEHSKLTNQFYTKVSDGISYGIDWRTGGSYMRTVDTYTFYQAFKTKH